MRTTIKSLAIAIAAVICFATETNAQKINAAIVDQYNTAEFSNYKVMMIGLAAIYALYMVVNMKRKRELSRLIGKSK